MIYFENVLDYGDLELEKINCWHDMLNFMFFYDCLFGGDGKKFSTRY